MAAPKNKSQKIPQKVRILDGKVLKPTLYHGQFGKYMAATLDEQLVRSESGRPIEFKNAGVLQYP